MVNIARMASPDHVSDSDTELEEVEEKKQKKAFRISSKSFFITYPQCDGKGITKENLLEFFKGFGRVTEYVIGEELHEDGGTHFHCAIQYADKLTSKNERYFDFKGAHPNVQSAKGWNNVKAYCGKTGNCIRKVEFDDTTPHNYKKRKQDHVMWTKDQEAKVMEEVKWPILLPQVDPIYDFPYDPTNMGKCRHLWVVGRPDLGKTTWIQNTFAGKSVFLRRETKYPYEAYKGQKVIIYDDISPEFKEIAQVSTRWLLEQHVYGDTRYNEVYWPLNTDIVMIVVSNHHPSYGIDMAGFNARFVVVDLNRQEDVRQTWGDHAIVRDPLVL